MKFSFLRRNDWNLLFIRISCIFIPQKQTCVKKEMPVRILAVLWLDLEGWFPSTCILVFCLQVFATTDRSKKHKVRITFCITTVLQCLEILTESISLKVWIQLYVKQNANIQQKQNKIIEKKMPPIPHPLAYQACYKQCCDFYVQLAQSIKKKWLWQK